ncbi:hypothetical protein QUA27_13035 [Microcoleus sp. Pol14C6]|uniref:hypothetical protein n=1 Tax=unclassified Microcoleus TaxID=2642155 RepID=UPI002FD02E6F
MSFEFEGVNQFSVEVEQDSTVQEQQSPVNSVAEELDDTELDAIAGGLTFFNWSRLQWYGPTERISTEDFASDFASHIAGKKAG